MTDSAPMNLSGDGGTFMPGHGGFLDRFDAFLFVIPFVFFYIAFFRSIL